MQQHAGGGLAGSSGVVKGAAQDVVRCAGSQASIWYLGRKWDSFMHQMKGLSKRKAQTRKARNFITRVFLNTDKSVSANSNEKAMNKVMPLFEGRGKGAELTSSKGTAFGLLNAVTEFVYRGRRARSADYRLESAWLGKGAALKEKALSLTDLMIA